MISSLAGTIRKRRGEIIVCGYLILVLLFRLFPDSWNTSFLSGNELKVSLLTVWTIAGWISRGLSPAVVGLLNAVSLVFAEIITFTQGVHCLGNTTVVLVFSVLLLAESIRVSGIERRVSLWLLKIAGGHAEYTVLMVMFTLFLLTFFVPSAVGRVGILLPIASGLCREFNDENFSKMLMIGMTFGTLISSTSCITGASGVFYGVELFKEQIGFEWTYLQWARAYTPINLVSTILIWYVLKRLFPPSPSCISKGREFITASYAKLGPMKRLEHKMVMVVIAMLVLWMTEPLHHFSVGLTALTLSLCTVLPGIGIIDWDEALKRINWSTLILLASSVVMATAVSTSGLHLSLAEVLSSLLAGKSPATMALVILVSVVLLRFGLNNITTINAVMLPITFAVANSTSTNPVWLGMVAMAAGKIGFYLPAQSVSALATFSTGLYDSHDLMKAGAVVTPIVIVVILLFSVFYWPTIGLAP
jgi:sodium-dependent dicarboxylate transporter 2/3/5